MASTKTFKTLTDVQIERSRQNTKWGDQSGNDAGTWLGVLGEEFGEVCKECIQVTHRGVKPTPNLRIELIQVAAVAVAWAEALAEEV